MAYALGIDIGTTYTAAAAWRDGRAATVPLGDRAHSVPSALFLRDDGVMLVGDAANRRGTTDPNRVAREFKRRLGDEAPLLLGDTEMSAQQLTGYLVRWVVEKVTEREGEPPAHVTLTCPATWGDYRRQLMTEAAGTARLTDVGLLPEPVAAAVYYASQERLDPDSLVAVYDLGGGTFDATVVRKTDGGFEVHGTAGGDETVGGTDFDQVVMDHVASTTGLRWAEFDTADPTVLAGLAQVRAHAVGAKEALSTDVDATIPVILPDVTRDVRITRAEFEAAIRIPILRTVDTLAQTLAAAGVEPAELRAVLLVGGSSRIPLVSRLIATELGVPVAVDAHPKYAVCLGAAISAGSRLPATAPRFGAPPATPPSTTAPLPVTAPPATAPPAAALFATSPPAAAPPAAAPPVGAPPAAASPAAGAPAVEPAVWRPPGAAPDPAAWAPPGVAADPAREAPAWEAPAWEGPTVQTPAVGAPDVPADEGAELLAAEPAPHAAVHVDLAGAGLDVPLDVLLRPEPVPTRPMPRLTGQDEPLTVDHTGDPRRGRLTVLAVAAAAMVVVASASALGVAAGSGGPEPTGPVGTGPPSAGPASTPPTATEPALPPATLTAQPVPGRHGDVMRAVVALPDGGLVAVGSSTVEGVPRAWRYRAGQWSRAAGPTGRSTLRGAMTGVAYGGQGLVAVGWVAPRNAGDSAVVRKPAIWTSKDGGRWTLLPANAVGGAATGTVRLGELSDVAARPGGGFVATGIDWGADPESGDAAVLTSTDGRGWRQSPAAGLDGPGPTSLRRLLPGGGGAVTAIGNRLDGSVSRSVVWTSPDARTWSVASGLDSPDAAQASAWGLARTAGGMLVAAGFSVPPGGTATPVLWTGRTPTSLRLRPVDGTAASIYAIVVTGARITAIGAQRKGQESVAAAWTVQLP